MEPENKSRVETREEETKTQAHTEAQNWWEAAQYAERAGESQR